MDTTPLMRLFQLLMDDGVGLTWLADQTGRARQTLSDIRNGNTAQPHPTTRRSLEEVLDLPEQTIDRVMAGSLEPEAAVAIRGQRTRPITPTDVRVRLQMIETEIGALQAELRSSRAETAELRALVDRLLPSTR